MSPTRFSKKRRRSNALTQSAEKSSQHGLKDAEQLFKFNTSIIYLIIFLVAIGIIVQIARWQIFNHEKFLAMAKAQYLDTQRQESGRGTILSSDGTVLATDEPSWDIYASLSSIKDERIDFFNEKAKYVKQVSKILHLEEADVDKLLTDDFRYVSLAKHVSTEQKKALEELQIFEATVVNYTGTKHYKRDPGFGLYFEKSEKRVYPNNNLASHILGFMGKDDEGNDVGLYGIEGFYFGDLLGTQGYTYEEQDANGNVILTSEYDPVLPRAGKSIKLTINTGIQSKVEKLLKNGVERYQAKSGTVIIMDPNTGAIIAMANYPDYNPNEYWRTRDPAIFKNKAVGSVYEPGSVFKPITVAIGLETGAITTDTTCNDETGYIKIFEGTVDEKTIYTWDRKPDGLLHPGDYLRYSNNPCIVTTALAVGHKAYYPLMKQFGIGEYIGIGLQDESNSYLMPFESWTKLDLAVTSFGQSVSTTPLQILSALSTIANEGNRMRPYIVEEVIDESEVIKYKPKVIAMPISEKTADAVAEMMVSVVRQGDGNFFFNKYLSNYDIAGKTGTAQIPKENEVGYYTDRTNATYIAFSPVKDAKMIMLVRLEEPGTDQYSSNTAAPLWTEIFMNVASDLEIPTK